MGKYLSAEEILQADDIEYEDVDVPEWGGTVKVKSLTGNERERFEMAAGFLKDGIWKSKGNNGARLVQMSLVEPRFTEEQISRLGRKSNAALRRVVEASMRLSGLREEDLDWLEGNSPRGQSDDSSSTSPSLSAAPSPNSSKVSPVAS